MSATDARTRVVVTGLGTTSPVGGDAPSTWEALVAGRSGVRRLTQPWAEEMAVKIGAPALVDPTDVLERVKARRLDRSSQLAMVAAMEAWADSGLVTAQADGDLDGKRDLARLRQLGDSIASRQSFDVNTLQQATERAREQHGAQRRQGGVLPYFLIFDVGAALLSCILIFLQMAALS